MANNLGHSEDYFLKQLKKDVIDYGVELQKINKTQVSNIDQLSKAEQQKLATLVGQIKRDEENIQYLRKRNAEKLAKIKTSQIYALQTAELDVEDNINTARINNIEALSQLQVESAKRMELANTEATSQIFQLQKSYEAALLDEKIHNLTRYSKTLYANLTERKKREDQINQEIYEKQTALGVSAESKLGKLAEKSIKEKSAREQAAERDKQNKAAILGKGQSISERLTGLAAMSSSIGLSGNNVSIKEARADRKALEASTGISGKEAIKQINNAEGGQEKLQQYAEAKAQMEAAKKTAAAMAENGEEGAEEAQMAADAAEAEYQATLEALEASGITQDIADLAEAAEDEENSTSKLLQQVTSGLADLMGELDGIVDQIALNKGQIDARLQGATSDWESVSDAVSGAVLDGSIKTETLANNIYAAVNKGIARDVESMGAIETIKTRIAPTFDTFNSTVLRLIKIQNQNTTYARLGMENSLNNLFNSLYQTTEYLNSLASSVKSNLEEAEALMGGVEAVDFEYQVQKWLGSLSSAGMSDSAVTAISDAFGKLAAGQIEGITEGGAGNLMVMAANNANLSISDILADGLDASETNQLMNAMVDYMQELVAEANGNNVVQQQLAKVFGMSASDLKAAVNILTTYTDTQSTLYNLNNSYSDFLTSAGNASAVTTGEFLNNMWANVKYSMATSIASSPTLYTLTKVASIMDNVADGVNFSLPLVMGSGVTQTFNVSDIMKSASLLGGFTKTLIAAIGGGGFGAAQKLAARGAGSSVSISAGTATSSSGSGTVYNGSVEDMESSATSETSDSSSKKVASAKEESDEVSTKVINENIVNIYTILKSVVDGDELLHVKMGSSATNDSMKVEVTNYDQFVAGRYNWDTASGTLTDTWASTTITTWTNPAAI